MSKKYAKVLFEIALFKAFDYIVPNHLKDEIEIGSIVKAPFGSRILDGYVVEFIEQTSVNALKEILDVCAEKIFLESDLFALAKWISEYYICPMGLTLKAVYPTYVRKKRKEKKVLFVSLIKNNEEVIRYIDSIEGKFVRQVAVLNYLLKRKEQYLPQEEIFKQTGTDKKVLESLKKKELVALVSESELVARGEEVKKYRYVDSVKTKKLTSDQKNVLDKILSLLKTDSFAPVVLHGVTGSGKTEIYLRTIQQVIAVGKQAIVLIPEISLTPQTEERFRKKFGDLVAVFHSRLSDTERSREWKKMRNGKAMLVVGARSAVFAPFTNLGLIVVDEEHERTYKQEEAPRYNARDVAVLRAKISKIPVILGSATPSLESLLNCKIGKYKMMELPSRVDDRLMPEIHLVDLEREAKSEKRMVIFSYLLKEKIKDRLEKGEQVIIFLNRRGFSSMAMCTECGYIYECENCSVSMTYHKSIEKLMCHFCASMINKPKFCIKCGSSELKFSGVGTQKIERALKSIFPDARILRMDSDTTGNKNAHEELLGQFRRGKADILIGTQMIAKGLDFPRVTLVGVVLAESSLRMPDFRASEITFQLLTQVSGRAGRGEIPGEVVIQTFMSEHPAVVYALSQDYHAFSDNELDARKSLSYPPYYRFINIIVSGKDQKKTRWVSAQLIKYIHQSAGSRLEIKGPYPSLVHRKRGYFYWNLLLKTKTVLGVTQQIKDSLGKCKKFSGVKVAVDVDPYFIS